MERIGIERYVEWVGEEAVANIFRAARSLYGVRLLEVSSTFHGGGVAGMLNSLIPLFNDVGINADWSLLYGDPALFQVTKRLHNAMQGEAVRLSDREVENYLSVNETFARYSPVSHHDVVIVHDPQPLPMIRYRQKEVPWVWRCHIDLSTPSDDVWRMLKSFILRYDAVVVSSEAFRKADLPVETHIIPPAIDPLSEINRELGEKAQADKLSDYDIPKDKPLIVQVSRFDKWKDPQGVLTVFKRVREAVDCQLVMIGNMATDDPEGPKIFEDIFLQAQEMEDVHLITQTDATLVNALQRAAAVVLQLSLREGFGLTVSEALWKGTPVVATNVGGIPLQVLDGKTGYLVEPGDYGAAAERVAQILRDPGLRVELGARGRAHVRQHFLIPRLLLDWLGLLRGIVKA
jgi:trehalose synthase